MKINRLLDLDQLYMDSTSTRNKCTSASRLYLIIPRPAFSNCNL